MNNNSKQLDQQVDEIKPADKALHVFAELSDSIPDIGFLNRNKRLRAYITVTEKAQQKIETEQINNDEALFLLSMLARKNKDFQKAAMMAALSLAKLDLKLFSAIGVQFANEIRTNLKLIPVEEKTTVHL